MKELKQQIIGKEVEAAKEKRPKTLIEAKVYMSEWCNARGKQGTYDLLINCLALAYLKNPHLNDETYEWILWTWEMKESLKVEKMTSEELSGAYEKVLKQKMLAELNLGVKENYEKETVNGDDEPGLVADLLQGLNLSMDDNNKMFKPGNTRVKKENKLVDVYLYLLTWRKEGLRGQPEVKPQVTCEILLKNRVICLMFCFSIACYFSCFLI